MTFYHYTSTPFALDPSRIYAQDDHRFKPRGLWLSVEDETPDSFGWRHWCEDNDYGDLKHRAIVTLSLTANILHIDNVGALDLFTRKFLAPSRYRLDRSIDWPRVISLYDGVIIAPYLWERRLSEHTFWYYGWDCASGCVWNLSAVESATTDEVYMPTVRDQLQED